MLRPSQIEHEMCLKFRIEYYFRQCLYISQLMCCNPNPPVMIFADATFRRKLSHDVDEFMCE